MIFLAPFVSFLNYVRQIFSDGGHFGVLVLPCHVHLVGVINKPNKLKARVSFLVVFHASGDKKNNQLALETDRPYRRPPLSASSLFSQLS